MKKKQLKAARDYAGDRLDCCSYSNDCHYQLMIKLINAKLAKKEKRKRGTSASVMEGEQPERRVSGVANRRERGHWGSRRGYANIDRRQS